jgi:hypothetical protein
MEEWGGRGGCTDRVDGSILLSPFVELNPGLCLRDRELLANEWEAHGTRRKVKPFMDVDEKESENKGDDAYEIGKKSLHREGMRYHCNRRRFLYLVDRADLSEVKEVKVEK